MDAYVTRSGKNDFPGPMPTGQDGVRRTAAQKELARTSALIVVATNALESAFRGRERTLFPAVLPPGRPSFLSVAASAFVSKKAVEWRGGDHNTSPKTWAELCVKDFFEARAAGAGTVAASATADTSGSDSDTAGGAEAGVGAGTGTAGTGAGVAATPKRNLWASFPARRAIQLMCHNFAPSGKHVSFATPTELAQRVKDKLELRTTVALATASDWLAKEKAAYNLALRGEQSMIQAIVTKPKDGLAGLLFALREDESLEAVIKKELMKDTHRNSVFTPGMRAKLVDELKPLIGHTGFRPSFVANMASCVYLESLGGDVPPWHPSPSWVYDFMHEELGCAYRRATSSRPDIPHLAETNALQLLNEQRIAILRADGWRDFQFMTNDQFGAHLYPQHKSVWIETGSIDVFVDDFEDKRQYTGNVCGNGEGEVRHGASGASARPQRSHSVLPPTPFPPP
jgi:hypothetical protein